MKEIFLNIIKWFEWNGRRWLCYFGEIISILLILYVVKPTMINGETMSIFILGFILLIYSLRMEKDIEYQDLSMGSIELVSILESLLDDLKTNYPDIFDKLIENYKNDEETELLWEE